MLVTFASRNVTFVYLQREHSNAALEKIKGTNLETTDLSHKLTRT